jgi:uncharacterized protein (TIGR01244 family)
MRASMFTLSLLLTAAVASPLAQGTSSSVTKETLPGISNFARVGTTVACAGATTPESMAEVKRLGFASVINLRQASESGANVEAEEAAAKAAGLRYIHLPFNSAAPDPAVADRFLKIVTEKANEPAFIHCASANRAAALWMIKRVRVDGWDQARAAEEAAALGLSSAGLKQFVSDYLAAPRR